MWSVQVVFLICLPLCLTIPLETIETTFNNVTFRLYSVFTEKFKKTIVSSNSLKEFLPNIAFDEIEFKEQRIPVLYENSLSNLDNVDELVIEYCEVHEITPGALKNVPLLRRLSLKGNQLTEIKEGVFNNLPLSTLDLGLNSLSTIAPGAFNDMSNLLNINLADNKLAVWNPNWFHNTPLLTRISLQNNSIEKLPSHSFINLKGEKAYGKVDLSINLIFSHNKINYLDPEAFSGLTKINNLWLDNNSIDEFENRLLENIEIDDLRINNNNIECFHGDLDEVFRAQTTHIDANPINCECLERIKEWSKKSQRIVNYFYADIECRAQRINAKMVSLEKRLNEIRTQGAEIDTLIETNKAELDQDLPLK